MKSSIIFFDNFENSGKRGTLRGMVIFPIFILLSIIWIYTSKSLYKNNIDEVPISRKIASLIFISLAIVSALGVHNPDTIKKAIVYGGLVGAVTYGIMSAGMYMTSNKWSITNSTITTLWGIISTSLLGYILFVVVKKYPNTLAVI